jgi:hypothetical protein
VGWFWGWTFLSATLALLAGAEAAPRLESWLSALATCTAIASCAAGVAGAFLFRDRARMPRRVLALVALAGLTALLLQWRVDALDDILPVEIPLAVCAQPPHGRIADGVRDRNRVDVDDGPQRFRRRAAVHARQGAHRTLLVV